MEQYKSNSNSSREKEKEKDIPKKKNIEKVTKGAARTKKKSKFLDSFIAEDVKDVKDYLIGDVLVPTIKNTIAEMVSNGVDMALFGEVRHGRKKSQRGNRTPYRDYYDRRDDRRRESRRGAAYDFESVIVESRGEAELVLDRMDEIIDNYDSVSITDLYDLVGYDGGKYTDSKYGWTSLRGVDITRLRDGSYEIVMPAPKQID